MKEKWKWSHSVMSSSLWPHGLYPARLLHPWNFPGKNTGVGCRFLLQEIFPTQGLNSRLQHCRQTLYRLSHQGSPIYIYIYIKHRSIHISNIFKYILKYVNIYQTIYSLNICKYVFKVYKYTLSWPKSSFRYLCSIMCKNPNELFGQSAYIF